MKPLWLAVAAVVLAATVWQRRRLGTERSLIALLVAAAAAVYGSGVVELPNFETIIQDVGRTLGPWTYLLVGALAFAETGAFIGLIAPGEFTIIFGGVIAGQGQINVLILLAVVWFCAVLGDTCSFFLGRRLGRGFMLEHGPKVGITHERLETVERFFDKHGGETILIGRFVGLVRAIAPFIAGASKMTLRRFLPYDVIGAGLWAATFVLLGYFFSRSLEKVASYASKGAFALGTVIVVVVGVTWAVRHFRVPENRARARAWLHEHEEEPYLRLPLKVGRPLYARVLRPAWEWISPPVRWLWDRLTPGELGLELTTLLAIAFSAGFLFVLLASLVADERSFLMDRQAFDVAARLDANVLVDLAKVVSWLGSSVVVAVVVLATAGFLVTRRRAVDGLALLAASVVTLLAVHAVKAAEDRPRPAEPLTDTLGSSFPSAHAAYAIAYIAVAVALTHAIPVLQRSALVVGSVVLATVIGLTRVYLRAHYLSDVIGGWALGATIFSVAGIVALVVGFLRQNPQPRRQPQHQP